MAFDTKDLSRYDGSPVELFLFRDDVAQQTWALTTGDEDIIDGLVTYRRGEINRSSIKAASADPSSGITVKVLSSSNLAQQFKAYLPTRPISLVVTRFHVTDGAAERRTMFVGQVTTTSFDADGFTTFNCQSVLKGIQRKVPWQVYKSGCNWPLYGFGCGVLRDGFAMPAGSYAQTGATILSTAFAAHPDGWFNNGYIEVVATGERRFILNHVGSTLMLNYPFVNLAAGTALTAYAGCDRKRETCRTKFNNLQSQLAFDFIPTENPYDTNLGPTENKTAGTAIGASVNIIRR